MIARIIRHEWRNLTADRTAWVVLLLFALVIGYGLYKGQAWTRSQQGALARMQQDEQERLGDIRKLIAEEESKAAAEGKPLTYPGWGPRHPYYVGVYRRQRFAALPPAPLAAMAVGQSDIYPSHFKVSAGMKESFMIAGDRKPVQAAGRVIRSGVRDHLLLSAADPRADVQSGGVRERGRDAS